MMGVVCVHLSDPHRPVETYNASHVHNVTTELR